MNTKLKPFKSIIWRVALLYHEFFLHHLELGWARCIKTCHIETLNKSLEVCDKFPHDPTTHTCLCNKSSHKWWEGWSAHLFILFAHTNMMSKLPWFTHTCKLTCMPASCYIYMWSWLWSRANFLFLSLSLPPPIPPRMLTCRYVLAPQPSYSMAQL